MSSSAMSFKRVGLFPANPSTERAFAAKLSASKGKILYTNGRSVIIRDLTDTSLATVYSQHTDNATVARISPSGYYCASADAGGNVRIWDVFGEDQTQKAEYNILSGNRINDLEWDGESKRIIAVGEGKESFGRAFYMDSGSSAGEISGHSQRVNAVSIRHKRPFRAVTASDDRSIVFYHGSPYKFSKTIQTHTKFVQDVRYSPSGDHFVSVGSDMKMFIYDGTTGDTLAEFTEDSHTGSVMSCSWSPDSKSLVTSSLDCTVKLWDVEQRKAIKTWTLGKGVDNHQLGSVWSGDADIVSLSYLGDLNVFDSRVRDKPARILYGPQKSITTLATSSDTFLAGTADGRIWSYTGSGEVSVVQGEGHGTLVTGLVSTSSGKVVSTGFDDRVREIKGNTFLKSCCPTLSQPKSVATEDGDVVFIAEVNGIEVIKHNQRAFELKTSYTPVSIATSKQIVAVGAEDQKVYLYKWNNEALQLEEDGVFEKGGSSISSVAFSPNGMMLAAGESSGRIVLYDVVERMVLSLWWSSHAARVNSLCWTADSAHCASGSLDTRVYVWSVAKPQRRVEILHAGPIGVNAVAWVGEGRLLSAGADACVRVWEVEFP